MRLACLFVFLFLACAMLVVIAGDSPPPRARRTARPSLHDDAPGGEHARQEPEAEVPARVVENHSEKPEIPEGEIAEEEIEEEPGAPPDDPVELGDCSLVLYVADEAKRPIEAAVQLWRLDAPGNEHWARGDQLQQKADVPEAGLRFDNLPAGRYRIYSVDQRRKSEDPPEFTVDRFLTTVRVELAMPREFSVHVRIYTETGHILMRAMRRDSGASSYRRGNRRPAWRKARQRRNGGNSYNSSLGIGCGFSRAPAYDVVGSERGFLLGSYREDGRESTTTSSHDFASEGRSKVSVYLKREVQRDRSYVALSVPTEPIVASIVMPDGGLARDAGARITIQCPAKLEAPDDPADAWRKLPIRVSVRLKGYETLAFQYRLGDTPAPRTLRTSGSQ